MAVITNINEIMIDTINDILNFFKLLRCNLNSKKGDVKNIIARIIKNKGNGKM